MSSYPEELTVVIPMYNEADRWKKAFEICRQFYDKQPHWEFIFVNDGSTDKTKELIQKSIESFSRMKLVSYDKNQGKGYALKQGVKKAGKHLILITDIDFSTPLSELNLLSPFIKQGADIVIGSRKVAGAKILKHQSCAREWLGARFTDLSNLWLGLNLSDITCGFKLFKTKVAKGLFRRQRISRWGYDAEILFLAHLKQYQIKEVAVTWKNDSRTKVSIVKDVLRSLYDLWLIRWNSWTGKYNS